MSKHLSKTITAQSILKVLVVGCGCSGALVAKYLRDRIASQAEWWDRLPKRDRSSETRLDDYVHLTMWDWARGPAGRMATFQSRSEDGERHVADVGAQVLSVRSSSDEEHLRSCGALDAIGLASNTCQRPPDATHLWMPGGLSRLRLMQIRDSLPAEVVFNRRVLSLILERGSLSVEAEVESPPHWLSTGRFQTSHSKPGHGHNVLTDSFDAVVLAVTAADALRLKGVRPALGSSNVSALENVIYDSRLSVTLMLSPALRSTIEALFSNGQSELDFECSMPPCRHGVLGLLAWQDRKLRPHEGYTVVVAHSTRLFARENLHDARSARQTPEERGLDAVIGALADLLDLSALRLREMVLDSKVIHWHQGQVRRFVPGDRECMVVPDAVEQQGAGPLLVLCGDYFTDATYSGCSRSAGAAANAVVAWAQSRLHV